MLINVKYDPSVSRAPAAFKAVVNSVVQFFDKTFVNPVTINIHVGYGEVGGQALSPGSLGQSLYALDSFAYSTIRNALVTHATSADDLAAIASLPLAKPVSGTFLVSQAEAKALGLIENSSAVDGYIGFAAGNKFDFNDGNGVTAGLYDFFGVVAHEITEVMGRALLVGAKIGSILHGYSLLDLFHYSSAGHRDFSGTTAGYFSLNGSVTRLDNFNVKASGDFGDWANNAGNDAFRAFSSPGVVNAISATDLREMDVLGWNRATVGATASASPTHSVSAADSALANGKSSPLHTALTGYFGREDDGALRNHAVRGSHESDRFIFRTPTGDATNDLSNSDFGQGGKIDLALEHFVSFHEAATGYWADHEPLVWLLGHHMHEVTSDFIIA